MILQTNSKKNGHEAWTGDDWEGNVAPLRPTPCHHRRSVGQGDQRGQGGDTWLYGGLGDGAVTTGRGMGGLPGDFGSQGDGIGATPTISKGRHAKAAVGEGAEFLGAASIAVFQRCLVYFLAASLLTDRVCRRPCECAPRVARCASTSSHIMLINYMGGSSPVEGSRGAFDCLTTSTWRGGSLCPCFRALLCV